MRPPAEVSWNALPAHAFGGSGMHSHVELPGPKQADAHRKQMREDRDLVAGLEQAALVRGNPRLVPIRAQGTTEILEKTAAVFHEDEGVAFPGGQRVEHDIAARVATDEDLALFETVVAALAMSVDGMSLDHADFEAGGRQQQIAPGLPDPRLPVLHTSQELLPPVPESGFRTGEGLQSFKRERTSVAPRGEIGSGAHFCCFCWRSSPRPRRPSLGS